jgi:hypothetical protein
MDSMGDLIAGAQKRFGLGQTLSAQRVIDVANGMPEIKWRAVSFNEGRLKIMMPAGVDVFFIRHQEQAIIKFVNGRLGNELVKSIVWRVGNLE